MIFITFLVLFLMVPPMVGAEEVPYSAIVMDITGKVAASQEGKSRSLDLGALLYPNEVVETAAGASLTINYLESGQEEQWPGGMRFSVRKTQSEPLHPSVTKGNRKIILPQIESSKKGGFTLRGTKANGSYRSIEVKGLSNSGTLSERPTFGWGAISGTEIYKVALYLKSQEEPLWQQTAMATQMQYPKDQPPLKSGYHYEWEVEALKHGKVIAKKPSCFYLPALSVFTDLSNQRNRFATRLSNHPEDTSTRLAFIFFLEQNGLYDEAVENYEILCKARQENQSIRKRQARLLQVRQSSCALGKTD